MLSEKSSITVSRWCIAMDAFAPEHSALGIAGANGIDFRYLSQLDIENVIDGCVVKGG